MIWVVTDVSHTKDELIPLIEKRGYTARHIDCVSDVTKMAKFSRPALLILDCGIANSSDLVTKIRADPQMVKLPLVMFTTSNEDHRVEAMSRGADAFVLKRSMDWAELLHEIIRFVGPPPGVTVP